MFSPEVNLVFKEQLEWKDFTVIEAMRFSANCAKWIINLSMTKFKPGYYVYWKTVFYLHDDISLRLSITLAVLPENDALAVWIETNNMAKYFFSQTSSVR